MASETKDTSSDSDDHWDQDRMEISHQSLPARAVEKKKSRKHKPKSMEDRLDTMSSTLMAMKEFLLKNGIIEITEGSAKANNGRKAAKLGKMLSENSASETMVYKTVLEKVDAEIVVQPEITFKAKPRSGKDRHCLVETNKGDSLSLDEHINTSDELMKVDLDLNDKFIA